MELIFGAGEIDRRVTDVESLLRDWRVKEMDFGQLYLEHQSATSPDRVFVEDLAVTMLINSRVDARQAMGVCAVRGLSVRHVPINHLYQVRYSFPVTMRVERCSPCLTSVYQPRSEPLSSHS